ncbi:hypothetical protein EJ08DRAFT_671574 [Tothia fuscella]|uniref:NAD(P)-binding protein n=1 Tax=Tothia fuscella TaxID=1048955 RepID=A0A9P4NMF1_9PEZI|nr:hypothetical protein EJ08DRAFT_671574 [Tothia fuscella]
MPSLDVIRSAIAELPNGNPLVVALTGGTTGIGSYVAKALATTFSKSGSKLRVYIVGRNATRAETVMAKGKEISPGSEWRFIEATDLALISEVDQACAEIIRLETEVSFHGGPVRLDLLYMSHCYPILKERSTGELPFGCPPPESYGVVGVRKHTCFMKNFFFEDLANKHAGKISFSHIYPGLVDGPGFTSDDMPTWFRYVWTLVKPLARLRGDEWAKGTSYEEVRTADTSKQVWDHTMETLERIEKENGKTAGKF